VGYRLSSVDIRILILRLELITPIARQSIPSNQFVSLLLKTKLNYQATVIPTLYYKSIQLAGEYLAFI